MGNKLPLLLLCFLLSSMASSLAYSVEEFTGSTGQRQQQCQMRCLSQGQSPTQCQQRCLGQISRGGSGGGFLDDIDETGDTSRQSQQQLQQTVQQCHQFCQSQVQTPGEQMQCTRSCVQQQMQQGGGGRGRGRAIASRAAEIDSSRQGEQQQDIYRQCSQMCQRHQGPSRMQCESQCADQQMQRGGSGRGIPMAVDSSRQRNPQQEIYQQCEQICQGQQGQSRMQCQRECLQEMSGAGRHGPVSPFSRGDPMCQKQCSQYYPMTAEWFMSQIRCQQQQQRGGGGGGQGSFRELETVIHGGSMEHCQQRCQTECGSQGRGSQQLQCQSRCLQSCMGSQQQGYGGGQQEAGSSGPMVFSE